jgi:hypothetical protein
MKKLKPGFIEMRQTGFESEVAFKFCQEIMTFAIGEWRE